jgi:tRNA 2-thiouridine synthesizing protein A
MDQMEPMVDLATRSTPTRASASGPPVLELDITGDVCPMTFVRTRLALDRMAPGDMLHVRLRGEEPWRNVVLNAEALGHALVSDEPGPDDVRLVLIRKR